MERAKLDILIDICKRFNEHSVNYVVCGAFASILYGVEKISKQFRPTKDYDFLIDSSKENVKKIKDSLKGLFSKIDGLRDDDLEKYGTIQIVEEESELVLDLIVNMWGVNYTKAKMDADIIKVKETKIPVLSLSNLIAMKKDSFRPQDRFDTYWLRQIKRGKNEKSPKC